MSEVSNAPTPVIENSEPNFRKGCWGGRPPTASIVPE